MTQLDRVFEVRRRRRHLVGLACVCLAMGLAHGLLLCVGCDGRASLHSGLHTHDHAGRHSEAPDADHGFADHHEDGHSHCSHCVDIPLSMHVAEGYVGSDPGPLSLLLESATGDLDNVPARRLDLHLKQTMGSTPYFTPLGSIILVV